MHYYSDCIVYATVGYSQLYAYNEWMCIHIHLTMHAHMDTGAKYGRLVYITVPNDPSVVIKYHRNNISPLRRTRAVWHLQRLI